MPRPGTSTERRGRLGAERGGPGPDAAVNTSQDGGAEAPHRLRSVGSLWARARPQRRVPSPAVPLRERGGGVAAAFPPGGRGAPRCPCRCRRPGAGEGWPGLCPSSLPPSAPPQSARLVGEGRGEAPARRVSRVAVGPKRRRPPLLAAPSRAGRRRRPGVSLPADPLSPRERCGRGEGEAAAPRVKAALKPRCRQSPRSRSGTESRRWRAWASAGGSGGCGTEPAGRPGETRSGLLGLCRLRFF